MARATGLEPATTGSTVRYSNQLSYAPAQGGRFRHPTGPALRLSAAWACLRHCIFPESAALSRSKGGGYGEA